MWGIRRQVSLLLANGHTHAQFYPLRRVFEETSIVVERQNKLLADQGKLMNKAVSAVISKKAAGHFNKLLEALEGTENGS